MKKRFLIAAALLALLSTLNSQLSTLLAQGTAFTYQGLLQANGSAANGNYDLTFAIFDHESGVAQVGATVTNSPTAVSNGLFTVTLDFGPGTFTGPRRWLEIGSRPTGSGTDFVILATRQELTPAPYAIYAASAGAATGVAASAVSAPQLNTAGGPSPGQVLSYNGSNLVWIAAGGGGASSNAWLLGGNGGTTGWDFLGTTDNAPLSLRVNGAPGLRLVPTVDSPQVIGGAGVNLVTAGMQGATIGGGGSIATYGSPYPNQIFANYGTIGGGLGNTIGTNAYESTIAGGNQNTIGVGASRSSIGGGILNVVSNTAATVAGGQNNSANGPYATVGGGAYNVAIDNQATVSGGYQCSANGAGATVGGGAYNVATGDYATVGGGYQNTANNTNATVGGGILNNDGAAAGLSSTIGGGDANFATGDYSSIGGGLFNRAAGDKSTVGGGFFNAATNTASTVSGGGGNYAPGYYATVPGGSQNSAEGSFSFAAGQNAHATHDGSFVWGDGTGAANSIGANTFAVRASGGVGFYVSGGSVNIASDGTLSCKVLTISGADVAEPFEISTKDLPKGSVVVIDEDNPGELKLSDHAYDKRVAGILSGANGVRAGICLSQPGFNDGGQNVALSGRVYVLADASTGPIKPGSLLTTSSIPGHAMAVTDYAKAQGAILGKAMTGLEEGQGMVLVLVSLQ
jgi:hypothetical protein